MFLYGTAGEIIKKQTKVGELSRPQCHNETSKRTVLGINGKVFDRRTISPLIALQLSEGKMKLRTKISILSLCIILWRKLDFINYPPQNRDIRDVFVSKRNSLNHVIGSDVTRLFLSLKGQFSLNKNFISEFYISRQILWHKNKNVIKPLWNGYKFLKLTARKFKVPHKNGSQHSNYRILSGWAEFRLETKNVFERSGIQLQKFISIS